MHWNENAQSVPRRSTKQAEVFGEKVYLLFLGVAWPVPSFHDNHGRQTRVKRTVMARPRYLRYFG